MTKLLASFVSSLICVSVVLADEPESSLMDRQIHMSGGVLEIIGGIPKVKSGSESSTVWFLSKADKGWTIRENYGGKRYLAVDKEGKLELVAGLGDGAYWKLNLKHVGHMEDKGEIQVSGGKFDGWYLGRSDKAQEHSWPKMYDAELSEKSGDRTKIFIDVDGP